jgi:hypothetical protein
MKDKKKSLRNKADKLLQLWVKINYTSCLLDDNRVDVGHHFFTKKSSNALRYYLPNIIPLCKRCHCLVHAQPHLVVPKICFIKGQDWYDDLIKVKQEYIKENIAWYQSHIDELEEMVKPREEI